MKGKRIGVIIILILLTSCFSQKNWDIVDISQEDVDNISFLDITENNEIIYTTNNESYLNKKGKKRNLDLKIISMLKIKDKDYYVVNKNKKVGLIDTNFKDIVAFKYDNIEKINDKYLKIKDKENFYLLEIDKYLIKGPYKDIKKYGDYVIKVEEKSGSKYLDKDGNILTELTSENVFFFKENKVVLRKNNKFDLYDIVEKKYLVKNSEEIYFSKNNILTKKFGNYYLNEEKIELEKIYPSINDVLVYDYKNGFGLYNLRDLESSNIVYEEIEYNFDRYLIVGKDGKYGVLDKYNQEEVNYEFDYIERVGSNSFEGGTSKIGLFALVVKGKKITEEKYEEFLEISDRYFLGVLKNKYTVLNDKGKIILECNKDDLIYYNKEALLVKERDEIKIVLLESDK